MTTSLRRLGMVSRDPSDTSQRTLKTLSWAEDATEALARYREDQPSPADCDRVDAYQSTPAEMLRNPHLKVRAVENELAHMIRNFLVTLEETLDADSSRGGLCGWAGAR